MLQSRKWQVYWCAALLGGIPTAGSAQQQPARYPVKPIRVIVPVVAGGTSGGSLGERKIVFTDPAKPTTCTIYDRDQLASGQVVHGPSAVVEYASTTVLFEGDVLTVAPSGELVIRINQVNPS